MTDGVYLILGSNIGARVEILAKALSMIEQKAGQIKAQSSVFETAAWGNKAQQPFLNQVVEIATTHTAQELLYLVLEIENELGRKRTEKWGPRTLDVDILYYQDQTINTTDLVLPHPHLQERRFVLIPLCELAPFFVHPVLKKNNLQLLQECADQLEVKIFNA